LAAVHWRINGVKSAGALSKGVKRVAPGWMSFLITLALRVSRREAKGQAVLEGR